MFALIQNSDKSVMASLDMLPKKSREEYERQHQLFLEWCANDHITKYSENVLMEYFADMTKRHSPPTMWSYYSMLKTTLSVKNDVDISNYKKLVPFLKQKSKGHILKRSKTLSEEEVIKFLLNAPDVTYLMMKVCTIFRIAGASRADELIKLSIDEIEDRESILIVHIPKTKTNKPRILIITADFEGGIKPIELYRKYIALRPPDVDNNRIFLSYRQGKCTKQPVGIHTVGGIPSKIAGYLNLPEPLLYTGNCFPRTSATFFVNVGDRNENLKHHGWKSDSVAEIAKTILGGVHQQEKRRSGILQNCEKERNPNTCLVSDEMEKENSSTNNIVTNTSKSFSIFGSLTSVPGYKLGDLIIEGKTKQVYDLPSIPGHVLLLSKDRITAGDGVKAHNLVGKAAISNKTNTKVFETLNAIGLKTAFVKVASDNSFVAKKCAMIPIEWVTRRLATGSFLRRHPGVEEGYRFYPPKHETFFKDDANHDPQWSEEQIISAKFKFNGRAIGQTEVDVMQKISILVFEILEKVWSTRNCALIDMKIEFGVDETGEILLADIIDSDSWRLWPSGDKRLMVDKQVYRNLTSVTQSDLDTVKRNFEWVNEQLDYLSPPNDHLVAIVMGSASDKDYCASIKKHCEALGLNAELRVTSAHKGTADTLKLVRYYESLPLKVIFIAVAGRSNGLGPVISGNSCQPVINCPPVKADNVERDIWSSLNVPSGLGCSTVVYPESAALNAAQIVALTNYIVWSKLRVKQLENLITLKKADDDLK